MYCGWWLVNQNKLQTHNTLGLPETDISSYYIYTCASFGYNVKCDLTYKYLYYDLYIHICNIICVICYIQYILICNLL